MFEKKIVLCLAILLVESMHGLSASLDQDFPGKSFIREGIMFSWGYDNLTNTLHTHMSIRVNNAHWTLKISFAKRFLLTRGESEAK